MKRNQTLHIIRLYLNKRSNVTSFTFMKMTLKKSVLKNIHSLSSIRKRPRFTSLTTKQLMKGISFFMEVSPPPVMKRSTTSKFKSPNNHNVNSIHPCILFLKKTINFNPINKSNTQQKRIQFFSITAIALLRTNFISTGLRNGQ